MNTELFHLDPSINSNEPHKEVEFVGMPLPNRSASTAKPFTLNDLDDCLNDSEPAEDAPLDTLTKVCLRNHDAITQILKRTALLAWKTGKLLNAIKKHVGHGNWETYCKEALGVGQPWGFSQTTVWRYQTLAKRIPEPPHDDETIIDAYRRTGIVQDAQKSYETVAGILGELAERANGLKAKIKRLLNARDRAYLELMDDEIDESAMELLTTQELELNEALKSVVDEIDYSPSTLFEKYPQFQEHMRTNYFNSITGGALTNIDLACVPDCILSDKQRAYLKRQQQQRKEEIEKNVSLEKRERGIRSVRQFHGETATDW